jgi:drug/metabolite transporter (DMT)-like permease
MPTLFMVIATLFWGASFLFIKLALQEISTASFIFLRFLIATASMVPILAFSSVKLDKRAIKQGTILGLLQLGIIFLQTLGLETISASLSGFLTGLYIVFVLAIQFITQRRMPSFIDIITSLACLGGLALLTHNFEITNGTGVLYTIGGAFAMALYIYALDAYSTNDDAILSTFIQMVSITGFSSMLFLSPGNSLQIPSKLITWVSIIFCGIFCSSISFWLQNKAQRHLGAFRVSIILMLEPIFCTIFACFILGDKLYAEAYIGIIMILASIAVINVRLKKSSR